MELVPFHPSAEDSYISAHLSECIAISALLLRTQWSEWKKHLPRVVDCIGGLLISGIITFVENRI
jgi:hypothetical protein